jgi:biotin operon repressor
LVVKIEGIMNTEDKILNVLKENTQSMSAGQLADATGIERKEVDKAMKALKTDGRITSPKRCFWTAS